MGQGLEWLSHANLKTLEPLKRLCFLNPKGPGPSPAPCLLKTPAHVSMDLLTMMRPNLEPPRGGACTREWRALSPAGVVGGYAAVGN